LKKKEITNYETASVVGVVEKHNFCGIQQKVLQNADFAIKQDLYPVPNG
jgi:hypothetical protein